MGGLKGVVLGPLLFSFLFFVGNDLLLMVNNAAIAMYADDSTIYTSANSPGEVELKSTEEWVTANTFVLNAEKTKMCSIWLQFILTQNILHHRRRDF